VEDRTFPHKDKLKKSGAELAGEMSGHIFFSDRYFGYDDAIYAAVRFLEAYVDNKLNGSISKVSDMVKGLPKVTTPLKSDLTVLMK